jgi:hypothetical protein
MPLYFTTATRFHRTAAAPLPSAFVFLIIAAAAATVHAVRTATSDAVQRPCLEGLQLHRQGRLQHAMQLYLQGIQQQQQKQQQRDSSLEMAPCMWGATLAFWAMARSQRDVAGGESVWSELARRSALAHRRLLCEWDGHANQHHILHQHQQQLPLDKRQQLLTCNGARGLADLHVDDTASMFHPRRVFQGCVVFVNAFLADIFFNLHMPFIRAKFVLITGCSDDESPGDWQHVAVDRRLIWWAAQNNAQPSRAIAPLPIGLPNDYDDDTLARAVQRCESSRSSGASRSIVLGVDESTHPGRRGLTDIFNRKGLVADNSRVSWEDYMISLCLAQHAVAPEGNGLDTHRFWECAAVGCRAVVVATHPLLPFYTAAAQPLVFEDWSDAADSLQKNEQPRHMSPSRPPVPETLKVCCTACDA